jgi:PIN domain nuclease of toxin-antitoxin system
MNLPKHSFDTHALVWYFKGSKTLSPKARSILNEAFLANSVPFISTMVLLEAFHISLKERDFIFAEFIKFLSNAKFIVIPLNEEVLKICYKLPKIVNIHDRIIMATAIFTKSQLVTKDKILRSNFPLETIW